MNAAVIARRDAAPPSAAGGHRPWIGRTGGTGRLRLVQGPIDLILDLAGPVRSVRGAEARAVAAFDGVLESLAGELALLRRPAGTGPAPAGPIARSMAAAVTPYSHWFITPMAAVAGAVADHILAALREETGLDRAVVNNGGDIALWLGSGQGYRIGVSDCRSQARSAVIDVRAGDGIGGVATSGWRGRSHSLGIADAVTVLAATAAAADAAATMIANAVDLPGHPGIERRPACVLAPDSDLGDRPVTIAVPVLDPADREAALMAGACRAREVIAMGGAHAVFLTLQGQVLCMDDVVREDIR